MTHSLMVQVGDMATFTYAEGNGPPVVMLHGMFSTGDSWTYSLDALKTDYRVIAPDMPGHGRSAAGPHPYGLGFYVAWLDGFLDALELPSVTLIGSSMGGAISLAYSMAYPARVNRLILVDALGVEDKIPWIAVKNIGLHLPNLIMAALSRGAHPHLLRLFQPWVYLDPWGPPREIIEHTAALNGSRGIWPVWAGVRLLLADFLIRRQRAAFLARLSHVGAPTLITWGQHDGVLPVEHAHLAARRIPTATLEIFERSAHEPMLEEPEAFNAAICRFLSTIPAADSHHDQLLDLTGQDRL